MPVWKASGVELPFGDEPRTWWIDGTGHRSSDPHHELMAEELPGKYLAWGLADAHAHPAIAAGTHGPLGLDAAGAHATLVAWAESGITLVRDVGSPGGLTLGLSPEPGRPAVFAAGRFLAPAGRYFPELLVEPVPDHELIAAAVGEIERGASWVKLIGDFPRVPEIVDNARTYDMELVARLCDAVHARGARVATHTTLPNASEFVRAGVDSIEHGNSMDTADVAALAEAGAAWTPTLCAVLASADDADAKPEHRQRANETRDRLRQLIPMAVGLGVRVLAGTDVVGSVAREVALLASIGLDPAEALAAATTWPHEVLRAEPRGDVVTYHHDPRSDVSELERPAAVVVDGVRIR